MNRRFLLGQLAQGFGAPVERQSFLWMAPMAPDRLATLWRRCALPTEALAAAFAPIDRCAAEAAGLAPIDLLLHLFLTTYLAEDILTKTDRASMFNGLEVRSPFLDRRFAEYALGLPRELKLRGRTRKYILKHLACRHLPRAIVERKKHGFAVPIGALIRTRLRERCRDVLLSRANPIADWFERSAIEALLDEHDRGRHDHGKKLWAMYTLFCVAGRRSPPVKVDRLPATAAAN
jgi:asparagine synthase (glutamine-hydrolysing)